MVKDSLSKTFKRTHKIFQLKENLNFRQKIRKPKKLETLVDCELDRKVQYCNE